MEKRDERIKKSLWYSILDGTFCSAMIGFGESFISAFAVFLRANSIQLGLLGSLPQTISSLLQLWSNWMIRLFGTRKRFVCTFSFLDAVMYVPIALVFFFGTFRVYHLILFVCVYWTFGTLIGPAWNSWMGDLVDEKERGTYFGQRNRIGGFTTFVSFLIAGYILQRFSTGTTAEYTGFCMIFGLALLSRILSFIFLTRMYEPKYVMVKEAEFSFVDFLKKARFTNYGLFVIYMCLMSFAVQVSAPFFTPYMLYDLAFDYKTYTIVIAAAQIVKILMLPVWGNLTDRYGTKKILTLTGFLMPIIPLLWTLTPKVWFIILIQAYSGFIWGGFELSAFTFIYDTTSPQKRATCIAYYNVLNGIMIFVGALLGSVIVRYNEIFLSKYLFVFFLSFIFRYLVSIIFLPMVREVRKVERISDSDLLLKVFTTMPTMGIIHDVITMGRRKR